MLDAVIMPWISPEPALVEFQSIPDTMLRSRIVHTAGNQKLIPIPHPCSRTAGADGGTGSATRHALRQSMRRSESQCPSATTASSGTKERRRRR